MPTDTKELKPQVYKDERPAEYFTRFHTRARNTSPRFVYELVRVILAPFVFTFYRLDAWNKDNVPSDGAITIAPRHQSNVDHFIVAAPLWRRVRFLAKSTLFVWPLWPILSFGGCFPVRRGNRDQEWYITSKSVLDRGQTLVMYPSAGRERGTEPPTAKPGVGKLALTTGTAVVPVGLYGTDHIRYWWRLPRKVIINYGKPIWFGYIENPTKEEQQEVADQVMERIMELSQEIVDNRKSWRHRLTLECFIRLCLVVAAVAVILELL